MRRLLHRICYVTLAGLALWGVWGIHAQSMRAAKARSAERVQMQAALDASPNPAQDPARINRSGLTMGPPTVRQAKARSNRQAKAARLGERSQQY